MRSGSPHKQRRSDRFPSLIHVICEHGDSRTCAQITDMSREGVFLNTVDPFQIGAVVRIAIPQPDPKNPVLFRAKVRHVREGVGVGLQFNEKSDGVWTILREITRPRVLVAADQETYDEFVGSIARQADGDGPSGAENANSAATDGLDGNTESANRRLAGVFITDPTRINVMISALKRGDIECVVDPCVRLNNVSVEVLADEGDRKKSSEEHKLAPANLTKNRDLVGFSHNLREVQRLIEMVADKNCSVLIAGETGTGKELVAKAIHDQGPRAKAPFVGINCGAIPEHLLEDELFGHVKGAYTSAHTHRIGRLEHADKGTLFLDEIGTMNPDLQVKLLRFLQEREFQKLGSNTNIKVNVRIIAATNMRLLDLVKENRFRADLYYRLHVFPINLAPLRQRPEDIQVLAAHFVKRFCAMYRCPLKTIDPVALDVLSEYHWPGNVRELENTMESAVILAGDSPVIEVDHLSSILEQLQEKLPFGVDLNMPEDGIDYQDVVYNLERNLLLEGLKRFGGNRSKAASYLNLKRTTLLEKMKRFNLQEEKLHAVAGK